MVNLMLSEQELKQNDNKLEQLAKIYNDDDMPENSTISTIVTVIATIIPTVILIVLFSI